jgi:hypothetical protein
MGALPIYEDVAERYGLYIDELREFFASYSLRYGSPDDLLPVTGLLRTHGTFPGDLGLVLRSILFRENSAISRTQLLEIIAVAIGGPRMERPPQQCWRPLSQLFAFITRVRRRPLNRTTEGAQLIPFPSAIVTGEPDESTPLPDPPETETPGFVAFFQRFMPSPSTFPQWLSVLLIAGAGAILIAAFLVFVLQPSAHSQTHSKINYTPTVLHAKPSAYGEAFLPALSTPVRRHRATPRPPAPDPQTQAAASTPPNSQTQAVR